MAALFEKWPGWLACCFSERRAIDHLSKTKLMVLIFGRCPNIN